MPMNSYWRRTQYGILSSAIVLYLLLPALGVQVWHRLVPEHDHWFLKPISLVQEDIAPTTSVIPTDDAVDGEAGRARKALVQIPSSSGAMPLVYFAADLSIFFVLAALLIYIGCVAEFLKSKLSFYSPPPEPPPTRLAA